MCRSFGQTGRLLLPQVYHVITYLDKLDFERFSSFELRQVLRSCLSWSEFGNQLWKHQVLGKLTKLEEFLDRGIEGQVLASKLRLRRRALARLYPKSFRMEKDPSNDPPPLTENPSSNAHYGEMILFQAQLLIDQDQLPDALVVLRNFQPLVSLDPSMEESRVLQNITLLRQKIHHFAGDFKTAIYYFEKTKECDVIFKQIIPNLTTDAVATYCELGQTQQTWEILPLADYSGMAWQELGKSGRGLSFAAAGVHLTSGFELLRGYKLDDSLSVFRKAKVIYKNLLTVYDTSSNHPSLVMITRQFSASVSLAMIGHVECKFGGANDWATVLSSWQSTLQIVERLKEVFDKDQLFLEMIIKYSMSNVLGCLGKQLEARKMCLESRSLYERTGRSFYFVALGSKWFDLVGDWNEAIGLERISELRLVLYCDTQKKTGYPHEEGSTRLCR